MVVLGAVATACGAAPTPLVVASYPKVPSGGNSSVAFADGPGIVETVYLVLEVDNPDGAAENAAQLAYGYGGYETDRYAWFADGGRAVSQEIFVPIDQAVALHARLLKMGRKNQDSGVRAPETMYGSGYDWAQFSIQYLPYRRTIEWHSSPGELFFQATCGFAARAAAVLVQVVASVLLAIAVVAPCGLIVVGAVTSIRWLLRKP
jgi:hypothetical protein